MAAVLAVVAGLVGWAVWPSAPRYHTFDQALGGQPEPTSDSPVTLDTTLYLPSSASPAHPVPAILLAHGFGATKRSVASDAADFADRGYAVLTWTARGFGASGGKIHLDSPDFEVRDAQRLLDALAQRSDIMHDGPGDPRVAVVGGSYGGALALMLAGYDRRVDATVAMVTWNDLAQAFLPESTGRGASAGVFKRAWAGLLFGSGGFDAGIGAADVVAGLGSSAASGNLPPEVAQRLGGFDPACGRFAADVCAAYLDLATTGVASPATLELLNRSSPASVLDRITAPTLLLQGQADSLFPLAQGEANYRAIAATGTPVRMDWFTGGHDGGAGPRSDQDRLRYLTIRWLDHYVRSQGGDPGTGFTFSRVSGFDAETRRLTTSAFSSAAYPGAGGGEPRRLTLTGPDQRIANPPDSNPAALSTLPGSGTASLFSLLTGVSLEIPGQHADFYTQPLAANLDVVGAPTVQILLAAPRGEAVVFVKLYDVDPQAGASLPFGLTAPVHLSGLPASLDKAKPVTVTLPTMVHRFEAGHRLRLTIASSDQAFRTPAAPGIYSVGLPTDGATLRLPQLTATAITNPEVVWRYVLAALAALLAIAVTTLVLVMRVRRRRLTAAALAEFADTPLAVRGLRKRYGDGFVAVANVDLTVQRGQVVGLLGPNGAGKTTTLRVLLGLTHPTSGQVLIFGHRLTPGAAVLGRVGALVEGPGFLPHETGLRNLELIWRATGRPASEAQLDQVLEIAGLGDAIHRKVRKYSHGMKQRLAIAQAMLGLPELLILDEPTDGLDPPQMAQMRRVLRDYATDGRAVLVSSHLLAEVEQTCTHVVVMHLGEIVASGPVEQVVGDSPVTMFEVSNVETAIGVLDRLAKVGTVTPDGPGALVADLDGTPRAEAVAALVGAGVGVNRVVPRRRLEDAFLALVSGPEVVRPPEQP